MKLRTGKTKYVKSVADAEQLQRDASQVEGDKANQVHADSLGSEYCSSMLDEHMCAMADHVDTVGEEPASALDNSTPPKRRKPLPLPSTSTFSFDKWRVK